MPRLPAFLVGCREHLTHGLQTTSRGPAGRRSPARGETPGAIAPPFRCTLKGCGRALLRPFRPLDGMASAGFPGFHPGLGSCGPSGHRNRLLTRSHAPRGNEGKTDTSGWYRGGSSVSCG